jgi:small subunit ribosomal protein S20
MANHKSALKRNRQTASRTEVNRNNLAQMRTGLKKIRAAIESEDAKTAQELLSSTASIVDCSVRKGVLTKNKAARVKSRLSRKVNELRKAAAAT